MKARKLLRTFFLALTCVVFFNVAYIIFGGMGTHTSVTSPHIEEINQILSIHFSKRTNEQRERLVELNKENDAFFQQRKERFSERRQKAAFERAQWAAKWGAMALVVLWFVFYCFFTMRRDPQR